MTQTTHPDRARHLPLAELALVAVTTSAVVSFARVFDDWSFFWPLLVVVAYAHLVTMILRRCGVGVGVSAIVSTLGFCLLASWLWFASTTTAGIPDASTWDAFTTSLSDAWQAFQDLTAPVPALTGFVVAAALAVFFAVFLADWAAFRLWSPVEALVPALTLFLFCTLLGSDRQRMTAAFAFCAAALAFLLAHRVARLETSSGWLTADIERGGRWLFRAGTALAAVAVVGGVVVGPRLPTANDAPLFDLREGDDGGPSSRVTVSPLVDIRGRLTDQNEVEVFRVRSPQPAYWRLTALDTFDGEIWRSGGRYGEARGDLDADRPEGVPVVTLEQRYEIDRLGALWLPAAYQPVRVDTQGATPRYERGSSTLIVDTSLPNSDQLAYDVVSELPAPSEEQLRASDPSFPSDMDDFLELPGNFSNRAEREARAVIEAAGAELPYDRALALQDYFRDRGVFADDGVDWEYALGERKGHDVDAIEAFLDSRRGYCEMYAGTYAAMARAIGLPSRVAVGFTWGDVDANDPTLYHVRGKHAHAWPEVWLGDQVGWLAFEPTPGRGAPEMERYNGITASQTDGSESGTAGASTTTSVVTSSTSSTTPSEADPADLGALLGTGESGSAGANDEGRPFVVTLGIAALVMLGLLAVYVLAVLGHAALRRRRRRGRATHPDGAVAVAWEESLEELELIGVVPRHSETHGEFAERASTRIPERGGELGKLAMLADVATFATDAVDDGEVARANDAASAIKDTVQARVSRTTRWRHRLDPRRLLRDSRIGGRQTARSSRG